MHSDCCCQRKEARPLQKIRGRSSHVRIIGCLLVRDYKTEDYSKILKDIDAGLDCVGDVSKMMSVIKSGGVSFFSKITNSSRKWLL
jgi:hypothetical protein